jgi:hypothetical protein
MWVQVYMIHFGKLFGTPKGPESGCKSFIGGRGSIGGNVLSVSFLPLLRTRTDHKQRLLFPSGQELPIFG